MTLPDPPKHLLPWQTLFFLVVVLGAILVVRHDEHVTVQKAEQAQQLVVEKAVQTNLAVNEKIVLSQINGCIRGHRLRDQLNYDTGLIRQAVQLAASAAKAQPGVAAQRRAAKYEKIVAKLRDVPQPDCAKVIYRP